MNNVYKLLFLVAPLGLVACGARTQSRTMDNPDEPRPVAHSPSRAHAAVDLTGFWATGSAAEPEARRIELRLQCNYTPALWLLEQAGDTVTAFLIAASQAQGVASRETPSRVGTRGRLSGTDLTLEMPGMRYALRYDSTSGHLRGTLNGAPVWAVRQDIVHPTGCIPPP